MVTDTNYGSGAGSGRPPGPRETEMTEQSRGPGNSGAETMPKTENRNVATIRDGRGGTGTGGGARPKG